MCKEHAPNVYLSLGSNVGDRMESLRVAVSLLREKMEVRRLSSVYETLPVGVTDQAMFLNMAAGVRTTLEPSRLLAVVKEIERQVGRRPTFRWGPRVVDIDILLYGDRVVDTPELTIPHVELPSRAFVLVPLAEIAADAVHPTARRTIREMAAVAQGVEGVTKVGRFYSRGLLVHDPDQMD